MKSRYDDLINYEYALNMFYKIRRNCKNKQAVYNFKLNLNSNICNILTLLKNKKYILLTHECILHRYKIYFHLSMCNQYLIILLKILLLFYQKLLKGPLSQ